MPNRRRNPNSELRRRRRKIRSNSQRCPNTRPWNMQDVENWLETEAGMQTARGRLRLTQKDREPLEKICETLERELGIKKCTIREYIARKRQRIYPEIDLDIADTARVVKAIENRVKTEKACKDIETFYNFIFKPRKVERKELIEARKILSQ